MREEPLNTENVTKTQSVNLNNSSSNNSSFRKIPGRVDINNLMLKVREEKKKQKKENLVFLGLVGSVVVITGIIASL